MQLLRTIVPSHLFSFREEGTVEEHAQHLISQCHPGGTGMQVVRIDGQTSEARIPYAQSNRALHGLMHGGCYFTVGDTLTAIMCLYHIEKATERMLTVNASIRYLRPIEKDTVRASARLARKKDRILDFVCDFFNESGKRAAQARYRYALAALQLER